MTASFWEPAVDSDLTLSQGDLLPDCPVPILPKSYPVSPADAKDVGSQPVEVRRGDLIVVTQTCDLANGKVKFASLCPVRPLAEYVGSDPNHWTDEACEEIRRGGRPSLHMLGSPERPGENRAALLVNFRQIVSLPTDYLGRHAESLAVRHRLRSPYLEHFSQAFARFFMRVGLPSDIPRFVD